MFDDRIKSLIKRISNTEDGRLISEALLSLNVGAYRSAYVMSWIAAAESLKRRIKFLAERDSEAGKVWGEIEDGEKKHHAVDTKIIDGAFSLGMISDIEKTRLSHIWENRSIYGHPYNTAPSEEDVRAVICFVADTILVREVKLKHSYVDDRLKYLLGDVTYLDDDNDTVSRYAIEVARRVDEKVHWYLFKKYIEGIKEIWGDPEKKLFRRRGMRFCKAYLERVGVDKVVPAGHWLDFMSTYPEMLSWFASWESIFRQLDGSSRDSAILKNIEYAKPSSLGRLRRLMEMVRSGVLSEPQAKHVHEAFSGLTGYQLHQTELPVTDLYTYAKDLLDSYDFASANSGSDFFFSYRFNELYKLSNAQQSDLGRSLCESAAMNAHEALSAIAKVASGLLEIPDTVKVGYCSRFFTEGVRNLLAKEFLCRNSIKVLFQLPATERVAIEDSFALVVQNNDQLSCLLKSDQGKYFAEAYGAAKQDA